MKKGITATSAAIIIVIIFILLGTVTVTSYTSIQNAKKLVFAIEISEIQEEVTRYYKDSVDNTYPVTINEYSINLSSLTTEIKEEQFASETQNASGSITVYEIDLTLIGISDTKYGNKENAKDVYALSKETGKVYYLEGVKANSTTYYTLTQDLIDIKERNDNNDVDEESKDSPIITTGGFVVSTNTKNKNIYLVDINVAGEQITKIKFEKGVIEESLAEEYFKSNGANLIGDRIAVSEGENITLYAENSSGKWSIKYEGIPKIPKGFYYVGGSIPTGVVISDDLVDANKGTSVTGDVVSDGLEGSQYVWVPVMDMNEFKTRDGYQNGVLQTQVIDGTTSEPFSKGVLSATNDLTGEYAEYSKMKASVEKYKGFYIARYEMGDGQATTVRTGVTTANQVVSKKNTHVYSYVPWGKDMTSVDLHETWEVDNVAGAVYLSRSLYPEAEEHEVVSTLCYGVQWDAIMNFMADVQNPSGTASKLYIYDSKNMGWYSNNYSGNNSQRKTGVDVDTKLANKIKNIYDLAGNVAEYTMEAIDNNSRAVRGGGFLDSGAVLPASSRMSITPEVADSGIGFRVALYLK